MDQNPFRWKEIMGRNVHCLRIHRNMTLEALADAAHISIEALKKVEAGEAPKKFSVNDLDRLCHALGVEVYALFIEDPYGLSKCRQSGI